MSNAPNRISAYLSFWTGMRRILWSSFHMCSTLEQRRLNNDMLLPWTLVDLHSPRRMNPCCVRWQASGSFLSCHYNIKKLSLSRNENHNLPHRLLWDLQSVFMFPRGWTTIFEISVNLPFAPPSKIPTSLTRYIIILPWNLPTKSSGLNSSTNLKNNFTVLVLQLGIEIQTAETWPSIMPVLCSHIV